MNSARESDARRQIFGALRASVIHPAIRSGIIILERCKLAQQMVKRNTRNRGDSLGAGNSRRWRGIRRSARRLRKLVRAAALTWRDLEFSRDLETGRLPPAMVTVARQLISAPRRCGSVLFPPLAPTMATISPCRTCKSTRRAR
jgi:hypothetical protein